LRKTAVDEQFHAGNEARIVGCQEHHGFGDFLGLDIDRFYNNVQGNTNAQQGGELYRANLLYPFLDALSRSLTDHSAKQADVEKGGYAAKQKDTTKARDAPEQEDAKKGKDVVVLIPLDDDQNTVLSFGVLSKDIPWRAGENNNPLPSKITPSVETEYNPYGNSDLAIGEANANNATITWHLDPTTFSKSINRQNQLIVPTAKLPSVLRIALLFDLEQMPFDKSNFAAPLDQEFWFPLEGRHPRDAPPPPIVLSRGFSSSVHLIPTSSPVVAYDYDLHKVYETRFLDSYGEEEPSLRCVILEYQVRVD
jgi:hypothetical protein